MFGFDPEVPAGYQDADIEMMELRAEADEITAEHERDCHAGYHEYYSTIEGLKCEWCGTMEEDVD